MTFFLPERSARFRAPLPGVHQVFNTALAIRATTALYSETITDQVIRTGLQQVKWPGRMQMLLQHPPLIFDGAHNPQGMRSAVQTLNQYFARKGLLLLLGFSADKDWQEMIRILLEEARFQIAGIIFTTPDAERGLPADTPAKHLEELYKPRPNRYNISDIAVCSELTAAVRKTRALQRQTGLPAFVCGSLYAAGTVMRVCAAISEEEQHLELERRGTEI
jgi:dihydrofolate synthase/folylpolyglutamate synthase